MFQNLSEVLNFLYWKLLRKNDFFFLNFETFYHIAKFKMLILFIRKNWMKNHTWKSFRIELKEFWIGRKVNCIIWEVSVSCLKLYESSVKKVAFRNWKTFKNIRKHWKTLDLFKNIGFFWNIKKHHKTLDLKNLGLFWSFQKTLRNIWKTLRNIIIFFKHWKT